MPEIFTHIGMKLRKSSKDGGCTIEIEFHSTAEDTLFNGSIDIDTLKTLICNTKNISESISDGLASDYMSELEKADAVYECLIKSVEYGDTENPYSYTAYAALSDRIAVCQGYSAAFNMLCDALGVKALAVFNDEHMWNVVLSDGKLYHYDVTLDDAGSCSYRKYCRIPEEEFIEDDHHKNYTLPHIDLFK